MAAAAALDTGLCHLIGSMKIYGKYGGKAS
jgi:hypothetical protein